MSRSALQEVLTDHVDAIVARWVAAWPEASPATGRALLARALAAIEGRVVAGPPSGLPIESVRTLRWSVLEQMGDALVRIGEVNAFDKVFRDEVVGGENAERDLRERLRFLADAGAVLGSSLDYHQTLKALAKLAVPRLADWCSVEIRRDDGLAEQLAVAHVDPQKVALAEALRKKFPPNPALTTSGLYRVLLTGESELYEVIPPELIARIPDDEQRTLTQALGLRSGVVVPIRAHGRVLGALSLVTAESGRHYTATDVLLAQEIADRAGLAIENAALYQKAQDAIRAREDFLSIASHELRTPLTALHLQISTLVAKAQSGQPTTLTKEKLARLDGQMARLRELVDQLLDVSRLATGRVAFSCEDTDLKDVVGAVVDELKEVAATGGSVIHLSASGDTRGSWDRGRLEQVVTNLVGNALKYGAGKDVEVVVGVDANDDAFVSIADHGVGIDNADLVRIFERFERAASARNFSGLGLGLWISNQIVLGHGGRIAVRSTIGHGATFTVTLPRRGATESRGST